MALLCLLLDDMKHVHVTSEFEQRARDMCFVLCCTLEKLFVKYQSCIMLHPGKAVCQIPKE